MEPETIVYISAATLTFAVTQFAGDSDRAPARFCSSVLLFNCLLSNIGWLQGASSAGPSAAAVSMIAMIFALFRWHRHWLLPLASLSASAMIVRGIFDWFPPDLYWYRIATVNALFVLQLATIVTASIGGRRGGQFDVRDRRGGGDRYISGGDAGSEE